jgi:hypothetical protein
MLSLDFRSTSQILPEYFFTCSDGFRHGNRVNTPACFTPFIVCFPKIGYVAFPYHLRDTSLDRVARERHVLKFVGFRPTSAISQPDLVDSDMNNCSEFWDLFDLEDCKRGAFLFFPRLIRPDLPWDKFGIIGNFGGRALTWLFLSSGRLN